MNAPKPRIPAVLCFAGLDPTGGAGLAADIEAIVSMGGHPLPIATALTVQDTHDVRALMPVEPGHVLDQARAVLADIPVAAVKIGLIGSPGVVDALHDLLADCEEIPVVLDPIGRAGGGASLADDRLMGAIASRLVPRTTVLTPNTREALRLAPEAETIADAAGRLVSSGCEYVLVTGADEATPRVVNRFYGRRGLIESIEWPRVEGVFHGSGCTLAAGDGATYVAFGSFFASPTKPHAVAAPIGLLADARAKLDVPIAAIGGITALNGAVLVEAGASFLAAIGGVFGEGDVEHAARTYAAMFS